MTTAAGRLILLGASNLSRGFSTLLAVARSVLGSPLEVFAALGHGRSYGSWSTVLVRSLPSIVECGLWKEIRNRPRLPSYALVTDVGNDIMYEAAEPDIVAWVETCVDRLASSGARTVLTLLPTASLRRVRRWQYELVRRVLFPNRGLAFRVAIDRALDLDRRLRQLSQERQVMPVEPAPQWYGFDPIHIKRRQRIRAWSQVAAAWSNMPAPFPIRGASWLEGGRLRLARPQEWRLLGWQTGRHQPALRLSDGTAVWLF